MEPQFTPEQESQLAQIASHAGMDATLLVKDAALRLLERDRRFLDSVDRGVAAADRGELIDEEEMDARVARLLES